MVLNRQISINIMIAEINWKEQLFITVCAEQMT